MKLISFYESKKLNELLKEMGASLQLMEGSNSWKNIEDSKLQELLRTGEVEVNVEELEIVDGVFEYKGQKVIVYIRDQYAKYYGKGGYKFHLTSCKTISDAFKDKRNSRYVISLRTDGFFKINLMEEDELIEENIMAPLKVCRNCLTSINYENYSSAGSNKNRIYENFRLSNYFKIFKSSHLNIGLFDNNERAPINTYNSNFSVVSRAIKEGAGYRCEECGINMSYRNHRKFAHVHHIDANKSNDHLTNLKVLCIECHSNKPGHERIKGSVEYYEFILAKRKGDLSY